MFKVDLHIHTVFGKDSAIAPEELVPAARRAGMDAVCVTEHHSFDLSAPFEKISQETGFPIFRGMEYKANEGHLLVFGVNMGRADMPPQMPMQQVIKWVDQRGGIGIPAHPYQPDMFGKSLSDRMLEIEGIQAIEGINASASDNQNKKADQAAKKMGWQQIGGSDAHGIHGIGRAYTVFPQAIATTKMLVEALKTDLRYYPEIQSR